MNIIRYNMETILFKRYFDKIDEIEKRYNTLCLSIKIDAVSDLITLLSDIFNDLKDNKISKEQYHQLFNKIDMLKKKMNKDRFGKEEISIH